MAPYGGEDAFFLWITGLAGGTVRPPLLSGHAVSEPDLALSSVLLHGHAPPSANGVPRAKARARILLAEDNEINQQIATELLEHVGVEIEVASNGKEAVDLFLRKDFDLILLDIQMPLMDGMEATRIIRASGKAGADTLPVLAMTAHAMSSDREKSLKVGMNDHLTKPIDPQLLYAALDTWLPKSVHALDRTPLDASDSVIAAPCAASVPPETGGRFSLAQAAAPTEAPQQELLFSLQGLDAQAGLSNVAGNRELYLRLLDRFAKNYRNSGAELRDALQRMERDASVHEEAVRLAHTAKGVAANLGARALAAAAGDLENAIKKNEVQEEMLVRYDLLLREALDSIESLPKRDEVRVGRKAVSSADKERIAVVLNVLPVLMQADWYDAQQKLQALAPALEGTVASAHFREITTALEEFDSEGVAAKGKLLLAAI
jgi:CheY-like chemotaxis protein/HPt (histidine-containing phosphotransfer) domain-containing protein